MTFVGEEYRETQATYRADIVVTAGRNRLLHVEQQTKHRGAMVAEMLRRGMDVPLTFKELVGQPGLVESWTPRPEVLVPHAEAPDVY